MQIGIQQQTSGEVRLRVYMGKPSPAGVPTLTSFDWDIYLTAAQWLALQVAVGATGFQAGTVHLEYLMPAGQSAGALSPILRD